MLDRDGFRPNVGVILLNARNQVFWGKRLKTHSWQFPQGGIKYGESPEQAMYRELHEEVGLKPEHVQLIARTRDWLRYEVPQHFIRKESRGHYKGQKQIWFLLRLVGRDCDMNLRATDHPEFDAWRWNEYWVPLDVVIEFKRGVYEPEPRRFDQRIDCGIGASGSIENEREIRPRVGRSGVDRDRCANALGRLGKLAGLIQHWVPSTCAGDLRGLLMVALRSQGNWRWEGPLGTPLGLVHWKRASSPVEAGTAGYL